MVEIQWNRKIFLQVLKFIQPMRIGYGTTVQLKNYKNFKRNGYNILNQSSIRY